MIITIFLIIILHLALFLCYNFKEKMIGGNFLNNQKIIQVEDKVPFHLLFPLSIQHMFAMFGASVLVPFLFGINPAIVLFMNGVGTLLFMFITKGKSPAYLGSSFAFLAPAGIVIATWGYSYALGGFVVVGLCGCILSAIIYKFGIDWINIVLPPAAMGPVVALIGLELAGTAANTAGILNNTSYVLDEASGLYEQVVTNIVPENVIVFLITLGFAVFGSVVFRKFFSVIPILIAIIVGYISALFTGVIGPATFQAVSDAPWFSIPNFQLPQFNIDAILIILPVLLVITSEHIGHQIVTSKVIDRDLLKDPGLHRSLFADSFSTMISGFIGSVPTTTYGENIGVMAVTKVYSVRVIAGAAVISIICSFVGKLSMLISTIPGPVIGGISFLLYGMIGAAGIRILVDAQVDYGKSRNLALTSVIFVVGLSGVAVRFGSIELQGMVLACVVGMILSLIFYVLDQLHLTNDRDDEHLYDQP
jgi:uracil permease